MLSLERRYAKIVRSYERLKGLYDLAMERQKLLREEIKALRAEVALLERDSRQRERASEHTMRNLLATTKYASARLIEAGDFEGSQKLDEWYDAMVETMQPVANVRALVDLLEGWVAAMPLDDPDDVANLYMRTSYELRRITGTDDAEVR